jgi:DNA polymerase-1
MKIVLIDGNAILHRAFHALPPLTTTKGELVNAVYGFTLMILKVVEDFHPEGLVVCFDRPKPTFRQAIFVGYQAKRPKMDEGLVSQIGKVHEVVEAMQVPIFEKDGFEADDLLGTLSLQAVGGPNRKKHKAKSRTNNQAIDVIIVTGDRDILQLVDAHTSVYMPVKGLSEAKLFGEKEVEEKFGIKSSQVIDYKALTGDSSDNYGGVNGIGPKTASSLLQKYQTLDNIYKNLERLPQAVALKLKDGKHSAYLARKLATIVRNVPVRLKIEEATTNDFGSERLINLLSDFEFHSLLKRLPGYQKAEKPAKKNKNEISKDQMELF